MRKPRKKPVRVDKICKVSAPVPVPDLLNRSFSTKSGGKLTVDFVVAKEDLDLLLVWNKKEVNKLPQDIRGLRRYTVDDLPKIGKDPQDGRGGNEFHKIRFEKIRVKTGKIALICEDVYGNRKRFVLEANQAVWVPPYILHSYEVLEEGTVLKILANTLFDPDDDETKDTYEAEEFYELQKQYT